jgi:hypothetical protein
MPKWARGEAEIEQLLVRGELERVTGAAADGTPLLEQARKTAATAAGLVSSDAYSAYVLAYDAARFACIALLAQQGLRATTSGGHYAVEQAARAQFGDGFRPFGTLRRRRNELEYPHLPSDAATPEEAEQAAGTAQMIITVAGKLLPQLSFFSQDQELQTTGHRKCFTGSFLYVPVLCRIAYHRKLVLPEQTQRHRMRTVGLPEIGKVSDKPSDNGSRQYQTGSDALTPISVGPPVIRLNTMPSDETARHGMQEVRGSNPLSSTFLQVSGILRS